MFKKGAYICNTEKQKGFNYEKFYDYLRKFKRQENRARVNQCERYTRRLTGSKKPVQKMQDKRNLIRGCKYNGDCTMNGHKNINSI